jgi:hypothetical protein
MDSREYLGDSVYVRMDEWGVVTMTTENGYPDDPRNTIIMEPEVVRAFQRWHARMMEKARQEAAMKAPIPV